jgi:hypothetical protein
MSDVKCEVTGIGKAQGKIREGDRDTKGIVENKIWGAG